MDDFEEKYVYVQQLQLGYLHLQADDALGRLERLDRLNRLLHGRGRGGGG